MGYSPWGHKESGCLFFHSSGGQDPKNVSFKISVSRATFFLEALGGNLFYLFIFFNFILFLNFT